MRLRAALKLSVHSPHCLTCAWETRVHRPAARGQGMRQRVKPAPEGASSRQNFLLYLRSPRLLAFSETLLYDSGCQREGDERKSRAGKDLTRRKRKQKAQRSHALHAPQHLPLCSVLVSPNNYYTPWNETSHLGLSQLH